MAGQLSFEELRAAVNIKTTRMHNGTYITRPAGMVGTIGKYKMPFAQGIGLTESRSIWSWVNNNRRSLEIVAAEEKSNE